MTWTIRRSTQSLFKGMQESYHGQVGDEIPDTFIDHLESTRVSVSSLFCDSKCRTEDFLKGRKACRARIFTSCPNILRADRL